MESATPAISLPYGSGFIVGARAGLTLVFALVLIGSYLAQGMPKIVVAALLFISPMSFLMSAVRNTRAARSSPASPSPGLRSWPAC
jgi:hypothetical protein